MTREEAIKYLKEMKDECNDTIHKVRYVTQEEVLDMAIKALEQERTGHWIPTYGNVKCSVCGSVKESRRVGKATHYCDFCGARMVEGSETE